MSELVSIRPLAEVRQTTVPEITDANWSRGLVKVAPFASPAPVIEPPPAPTKPAPAPQPERKPAPQRPAPPAPFEKPDPGKCPSTAPGPDPGRKHTVCRFIPHT